MVSPGRLHGSANCFQPKSGLLLTFINQAFCAVAAASAPSLGLKGFLVPALEQQLLSRVFL